MQPQEAPGTTFEKHLQIARGLLSEDDHLLGEILFNPYSISKLEQISQSLEKLKMMISKRDHHAMAGFLEEVRGNLI
jgi:prephenate dehydrogenase